MGRFRRLITSACAAIAKRSATVARDITGIAGAGLVAYGAWLIFHPAGFIVGGLFLLAAAFLSATST